VDTRRWVGRSGFIAQIILAATLVALISLMLWATIYISKAGQINDYRFWFVALWFLTLATGGILVWVIRYMAPRMVVMNAGGLTIRQHGVSHFIEWGDIAAITNVAATANSSPYIMVYPKPEYFVKLGQAVPGQVKLSMQWGIPWMSFLDRQVQEILESFHYFAWRSGQVSVNPVDESSPPPLVGKLRRSVGARTV